MTTVQTCALCGNEYDKAFSVTMGGKTFFFDSFECAIQALAPSCPRCGCKIIGHGVEEQDQIYCSAHCARQMGAFHVEDRG
jgi:nitrite reductase/ring-hydroxylating ferredoxin subunit